MRHLVILLLLLPFYVLGQTNAGKDIFANDPDFKISKVPDSLKDQSFVMLCLRDQYEFSALNTPRSAVYYGADSDRAIEKLRMRAALMDEAAVERFGFVSFEEGELRRVEIIKPDGSNELVDISDAVEVKREDVESKGIQNSKRKKSGRTAREEKFLKLALTSLTPGDIVDLTFQYEEDFAGAFEINFEVLNRPYPMLKHKLHFLFDEEVRNPRKDYKQMRFRFTSHNGAPELQEIDRYHYAFEAENLEAYERERWSMPAASLPFIKYGFYTSVALQVLGQQGATSSFQLPPLDKSDLREINTKLEGFGAKLSSKSYDKLLKAGNPPLKNLMKSDPIKHFPILYRHVKQFYIWPRHVEITYDRLRYLRYYLFSKFEIPANVVVVLPGYANEFEDLTFFQECNKGYRIPAEENIYLFDFSTFRIPGEIPYQYEGCLAIESAYYNKEEKRALDRKYDRSTKHQGMYRLPVSTFEDNRQHHEMMISLDLEAQETDINTTITTTGHLREYSWPYFMQYERFEDDIEFFDKMGFETNWNNKGATKEEMAQLESDKHERLINNVDDSWGDISIVEIEEIQPGRTEDKPASILRQHVTTQDMLKKVGPNYIFDAGMLIHSQSQFKDEERIRKTDIYMDYARTYEENISIMIPEGYLVEGLENFSFSEDNETGSFESNAIIAGDRVIINAKKVYKHNFEPKANWPLMLEFIDAAYAFSQGKLLFRKQ
jgi:hypothetical protein